MSKLLTQKDFLSNLYVDIGHLRQLMMHLESATRTTCLVQTEVTAKYVSAKLEVILREAEAQLSTEQKVTHAATFKHGKRNS